MAKQSPTLYSIAKTFIWFALASIILTLSLFGIVYIDHHREWKDTQKKFIKLKTEKAREELKAANQGVDKQKIEGISKAIAEAESAFRTHEKDYEKILAESAALDTKITKARGRYQDLKQFQDSYRYFFEEYSLHKDPKAASYDKKLKSLEPRLGQIKLELENLEKQKEEKDASAQGFISKEKELRKELDKVLDEKNLAEKRLKNIELTIAKEILDAPMLNFLAPTLKIQQIVLEDLQDDYHFARVQKVDRCTTCHLGIDQKAFESAPQPFKTHPDLDLYLGSNSPHPVEKFGCTVCHGGNGHSASFKDTAHTPRNQEQAKEWKNKYSWKELEKWDAKMLPLNHTQAACAKCHTNVVEVPKADKLNRGRALAETNGCVNCHKIAGFSLVGTESAWKSGPDLRNIASKVDKDWVVRWLQDPTSFRASTKMPKIFHLSNTSSPEDRERNNAVIESIAVYLMKHSSSVELLKPPFAGDKERGEKLVKEVGCLGCHTGAGVNVNDFGPELSALGSKVTPEWLYTWVKDPKRFSKDTRMPNMRLTDEQASDIVAYLLSQKNDSFEKTSLPEAKKEVRDEMILTHLQSTMRRTDAEKELGSMPEEEKFEYLGKKSIAHQGCYSCHNIKGFEDIKPIGAELTFEGSKELHQFDFGFIPIEHTRQDWIAQKLKDPRIFDQGKVKAYYDKLRMPQFNLSAEEIDDLTTFILSLTNSHVPLEMQRRLDLKDQKIEKGRLLVSKHNCNGCHTLDGKTGGLWTWAEDKGSAPPVIDGEGSKVQEKWLHAFLKEPTTIRPWLTTHMPTFDFSEEELTTLVEYFAYLAHEEVSYKGYETPVASAEKLGAGKTIFDKFQCAKCHQVNPESAKMGSSFLAPDLALTKHRLKPEWVKKWIQDPQAIQEDTMMPGFFPDGQSPVQDILEGDAGQQIEAIRDYLYTYEKTASDDPSKK